MRNKKVISRKWCVAAAAVLMLPVIGVSSAIAQEAIAQNANAQNAAANAIELRHKWVAGQKLAYDVLMDGTVNMQLSPSVPMPIAGIPIDLQMRGQSQTILDTVSVEENGTGTVVVRVPSLKLQAAAMGQRFDFTVLNGKSTVLLNGQPMGRGANPNNANNASALMEPPVAFKFSPLLKLQEVVPLKKEAENAVQNDAANPTAGFDWGQMYQNMLLRTLPTFLPEQAVKTGEKWSAAVRWPQNAAATAAPVPATPAADDLLGQFDFELTGSEEIAGRQVHRIALDGVFKIDDKKAAMLNKQMEEAAQKRERPVLQRLSNASQKVNGAFWFDAVAGQVVRVEMNIESQAFGRDNDTKPAAQNTADSWFDFNGTMQMQLKDEKPAAK